MGWEEAEESAANREDWRRSVGGPMCIMTRDDLLSLSLIAHNYLSVSL